MKSTKGRRAFLRETTVAAAAVLVGCTPADGETTPTRVPREASMMTVRRANERGHANHGWLDSHHTFSFADYYDPAQMGFRSLRVINEDRIAGGSGFPTHPHRDMEILSYVLEGGIQHRDSMGNGSVIRPGDVQRMTAGTGVRHSEYNASPSDEAHFLQIWLLPSAAGLMPGYEQRNFSADDKRGRLRRVASRTGAEGAIQINTDVELYAGLFDAGEQASLALGPSRHAWIQVARGSVKVNGETLVAGDGASFQAEPRLEIEGVADAEVLVFDLA